MEFSTCRHCGETIFWFARHSHWLHQQSHIRYCTCDRATITEAEPEPARQTITG